jgi:hypothetical protein
MARQKWLQYFSQADLMYSGGTIFMAGLLVAAICVTASAFAKRPAGAWNYSHFNGSAFVAGHPPEGGSFLALREQMLPVVVTGTPRTEEIALSPGHGAIAGLCYIQRSRGKLANVSGYSSVPGTPVKIFSGGKVVKAFETDEQGYFVMEITAGKYSVSSGPATVEVTVENGKTVLVPLRTGKRMAD